MHRHGQRVRYRRSELGNCLACDFARYTPSKPDRCVHYNTQTRFVHLALMRAGRVGMTETPLMRAFRTCGRVPFTPRMTMFRAPKARRARGEMLGEMMRNNRARGLYDLPDTIVPTR
jgi:hypothetical protein